MDATGVSHIAIRAADIDRSLGFYRDTLGMTVGLRTAAELVVINIQK